MERKAAIALNDALIPKLRTQGMGLRLFPSSSPEPIDCVIYRAQLNLLKRRASSQNMLLYQESYRKNISEYPPVSYSTGIRSWRTERPWRGPQRALSPNTLKRPATASFDYPFPQLSHHRECLQLGVRVRSDFLTREPPAIYLASFGRPCSSFTGLFSKSVPETLLSKIRCRDGVMRKPRRLPWGDLNQSRVRRTINRGRGPSPALPLRRSCECRDAAGTIWVYPLHAARGWYFLRQKIAYEK